MREIKAVEPVNAEPDKRAAHIVIDRGGRKIPEPHLDASARIQPANAKLAPIAELPTHIQAKIRVADREIPDLLTTLNLRQIVGLGLCMRRNEIPRHVAQRLVELERQARVGTDLQIRDQL